MHTENIFSSSSGMFREGGERSIKLFPLEKVAKNEEEENSSSFIAKTLSNPLPINQQAFPLVAKRAKRNFHPTSFLQLHRKGKWGMVLVRSEF
ncbi:hypothetical protein CEXT_423221 [Caerostris extrusa]|uniref:Uncharacterized protein n=1 Tax=Caerostris extrusa TaxID=172846 RepID=A0AAV4R975_CAEEX|nr:hypothetical protein CEXT_423221 [Caerostris extrusa]